MLRRRGRSRSRLADDGRATRGQTTLDFAIGISVFLAVLIFIFMFVPGLLSPFTEGAQEETVVSNRVADGLTKSMLGSPEQPYRLDRYCTVKFFDDQAAPATCTGSWSGGQPVESQMGLDANSQHLNVTIYGNVSAAGSGSDRLCWDDTADAIVEEGNASATCSVPFSRGEPAPTNNDQSVTATRVVSLAHHDVTVSVEVW